MAAIALSSFGIRGLRPGRFSLVHVVSIAMVSLFAGSLLVAGGFTLVPGRIMHTVVFGSSAH